MLQAEVTGAARMANGPGATVDLAAITITDGTDEARLAEDG